MNTQDRSLLDQLALAVDLCNINNLPEAARWITKYFWVIDGVPIATSHITFFNLYRGPVECVASEPGTAGKYAGVIRTKEGSGYRVGEVIITRYIHNTPDAAIQAARKYLSKIRAIHSRSLTTGASIDE
jgi:hypothetical protein